MKQPAVVFLSVAIIFQFVSPAVVIAQSPEPTNLQQMASLIASLQSVFNSLKSKVQAIIGGTKQTVQAQTADVTNGLVGHWKFDEASGTTAADSSGNNTGTLTNGPVWTAGKLGQALSFDGVNDYVGIPQTTNIVGGLSSFSVAAWAKSNVGHPPATNDQIVSIQNSGGQANKNFELFKANSNDSFGFRVYNSATSATVTGDAADAGGSWRHVAGVYDNGTLSVYVDGVKQSGSATLTVPTNNRAVPIHIGTSNGVTGTEDLWPGLIDDVRVYNRALTSAEVADLYNIGAGNPADTTPPTLSSGSPTGTLPAGTTSTTMSATTNENAACRYSTTAGTSYASMTGTFTTTGGTSHSTTISGLSNGQTYTRYIRCQDTAGNATTADYAVTFSVASATGDTTPPTVPSGLSATAQSSSQINLSWTASTDNVGVTGYRVERCQGSTCTNFAQIATPTGTSHNDTGLSANTAYRYQVRAADGTNNLSGYSSIANATTQAAPSQGSWTPPIGIPAPSFGINEVAPTLPSPWTSNVSGFYYVQEGGTNAGNGFPGSPRGSIPLTLAAGSVVILSGTYNVNHSNSPITANGTAANPVYIRGTSTTQRPTITQKWELYGSYYIIEYINATWANSSGNGKFNIYGNHGVVRHTDLRGDTGTGIGSLGPSGTDHVIWDNFLHDMGDIDAAFDQDVHCISVGNGTNNLWVVDNEIARCSGDGIQINGSSLSAVHHIYVGRNKSHDHKQTGMWTKTASDVVFSQNTIYNIRPSGSSGGQCSGAQYGPDYVWWIFNHLYECEGGIGTQGDSGFGAAQPTRFFIGNVIHDITDSGAGDPNNPHAVAAITLRGGFTNYVINNTLWNYQAGINSPSAGSVHMENNILGGRNNAQARDIYLEDASQASASNMRNNLLDPSSVRIQWGSGTIYTSLSAFQSATGKGQNSLQANPQFVNVVGKDFHLQSTSPAVNAGLLSSVYATFQSRYGIDLAKDFDKATRPQGSAWDMGAYEYGGTTPPPTTLIGDLNNDRIVNSLDWSLMNSAWSSNSTIADLNRDGIVNSLDFSLLNANWGRTS